MIEVIELEKRFPTPSGVPKLAVDRLSFRVGAGEIYGLLGPNGAGKTTTLRILSGLMQATNGRAILNGFDVAHNPTGVKQSIGFITAQAGLYHRLSPRELLTYFGQLYWLTGRQLHERVESLIDWLDMGEFADLRCGALSTGQKQRTNIARALLADPPILILDEPTLGLDVLTNRLILNFIRRQREEGKAILLSTHYLDEAESLCDRVGLLHHGQLLDEGNLDELRERTRNQRLTDIFLSIVDEDDRSAATHGHAPVTD
jgi:ABC-type multidrug transport system ATPase subunit